MAQSPIVIFGAGLVGCVLGLSLQRELKNNCPPIIIIEKRQDPRKEKTSITCQHRKRSSLNLVITSRGLNLLKQLDLSKEILSLCAPVRGRMIHCKDQAFFQPYGTRTTDVNYAISRKDFNNALLMHVEKQNINVIFSTSVKSIDLSSHSNKNIAFCEQILPNGTLKTFSITGTTFFGCDGAFSRCRAELLRMLNIKEDCYELLGLDYVEFTFPASAQTRTQYIPLDRTSLHIWSCENHFLMAVPDLEGTFTGTLYLPSSTSAPNITFTDLRKDRRLLISFLKTNYKEAMRYANSNSIHQLYQRIANPEHLGTVRCPYYYYKNRLLLLGDAVFGMVPFFGQGMNLGFESVSTLLRIINQEMRVKDNDKKIQVSKQQIPWEKIFAIMQQDFAKNATAMQDMAIENYIEMSQSTRDLIYPCIKAIEYAIELRYPKLYRSRYTLVTQTLLPLNLVKELGLLAKTEIKKLAQARVLNGYPSNIESIHFSSLEEQIIDRMVKSWQLLLEHSGKTCADLGF